MRVTDWQNKRTVGSGLDFTACPHTVSRKEKKTIKDMNPTFSLSHFTAALLLVAALPAQAVPLVLTDRRLVQAEANAHVLDNSAADTRFDSPMPLADFNGNLSADTAFTQARSQASASQFSILGQDSFSAEGTASASASSSAPDLSHGSAGAGSSGQSLFSLTFWLTEAAPYTLQGVLLESIITDPFSGASLTLESVTEILFNRAAAGSFNLSGVLEPGLYSLTAEALALANAGNGDDVSTSASYSFRLDVTPSTSVPEPGATALLLAGSVLALGAFRRWSAGV
jgi:hypothetical protein